MDSPSKKSSRYQAVPADEDNQNAHEVASLYSSPSNTLIPSEEETSSLVSQRHPLASSDVLSIASGRTSLTPTHLSLSRGNSSLGEEEDTDWDDEDEENLQRYSFVYSSTNNRTGAETPVTMLSNTPRRSMRMQEHWSNLRSAARQRRAARLLSMTDSWHHRMAVGFLNTCCDATDTGIALAAGVVLVWALLGAIVHANGWYWIVGLLLFLIRVSARRIFDWWRRRIRADSWKASRHGSIPIPSGEQEVV